jgi:TolB-like protein/Tfp pilus assembly protein PilF
LRQAGVEVWFDQSELRGGDQWDQKIRRQIKECALFVPVISAATQARAEGYFRLEWKLAVDRSHLMADDAPFLFPVVIDDTTDTAARVPEKFRDVQWTRLNVKDTPETLARRVGKMLGGTVEVERAVAVERGERPARKKQEQPAWLRYAWMGVGLLFAVIYAVRPLWQQAQRAESKPPPPAAAGAGATELARVRSQLTPDRWQREDFAAMAPTLDRLIEANPELADAWAMRSIINSLQVLRNYDSSTKPLEVGKAAADRAMRLAPGSPLADIATGMHLVAMTSRGGDARACRPYLDRGVAALPPDALTHYAQLASYWFAYDFDQVQRLGEEWRAAEPQASFPSWIFAQLNVVLRRPVEAEKWADIAQVDPNITGVRAFFTAFESKYYLRADVPAAWGVLQKVPAAGRSVHRVVHARWLVAMADRRWDDALQELAQVPETFLFDRAYHGPKALLAGLAHQRAGRPEAAAAQFREAERLLREHLAADSDNEELHLVLAVALACAGRGADARSELGLVEPLVKGRAPSIYRGSLVLTIAQTYAVLGDFSRLAPWLRKLLAEPSQFPFTPASFRLDARFAAAADAPELQALLTEFASLDQPAPAAAPKVDEKSVAVLAFANLSDDKANEYFSDGISEELLNVLAKVSGLKVSARTSSFHFKGTNTPIPEIARQLGVAYVVEGSVRKAGDKVRITAQLIKAADGFHVWSDTFTRDLKDIFAVQDEIAGLVAKNLELKLQVATRPEARVDARAFELYMQGRVAWNRRNAEGFDRAEILFRQALEIAPEFARAHAALADVWMIRAISDGKLSQYGQRVSAVIPPIEAEAQRALEIDPESAEAHATLGFLRQLQHRLDEALRLLRRSVELNPNYATGHHWLAGILAYQSWYDESIAEYRRAVAVDPLSPRILDNFGGMLVTLGRWREGLALIDRALALLPDEPQALTHKVIALAKLGRRDDARALAGKVTERNRVAVLCATGERAEIEAALPAAARADRFELLSNLGRLDEALNDFYSDDIVMEDTQQWFFNPQLVPFQRDPRFRKVVAELGFDDILARALAWQAAHPPEKPEVEK